MDSKNKWDELHKQKRYCPLYPSDRVVAWTFRNFQKNLEQQYRLLDLGCGAGRHALFWATEEYDVKACDFSKSGIEETRLRSRAKGLRLDAYQCEADLLPYADNEFDGVLSYGVLYYLTYKRYRAAVNEIHRVLKPGGKALVVTRTNMDSRIDNAIPLDICTYQLTNLGLNAPSDVESGMIMTFLGHDDVLKLFGAFSVTVIDRCTVTSNNGNFIDDDWLVQVIK